MQLIIHQCLSFGAVCLHWLARRLCLSTERKGCCMQGLHHPPGHLSMPLRSGMLRGYGTAQRACTMEPGFQPALATHVPNHLQSQQLVSSRCLVHCENIHWHCERLCVDSSARPLDHSYRGRWQAWRCLRWQHAACGSAGVNPLQRACLPPRRHSSCICPHRADSGFGTERLQLC